MAISETISVDAGPAIAGLDALATAAEEAAAKFEAAMGKLKVPAVGGAGADKLAASMEAAAAKIGESVAKIEASFARLAGTGDGAAAGVGKLGQAAEAAAGPLDAVAGGADKLAAANARLAETSNASAGAMDKQAVAGERAGKSSAAAAEGGTKFWSGLKVAVLGVGVAAAYGIDKAMGFNAEVTRLYTAAGLTHAPFQQVEKDLLRIGTQTGFTGTQIAQAMYHPVSAGLDLKTSLGLVTQAADLANIHGASLEDTTYALSSVMKAYNQSAKDVVPTSALLNSIVGQGDMRFQDFNQSVKNWAPTGASMGISIRSMGSALAYLTDRGNSAEVASTRLTMGLSMVTSPTKAASTYLKDLGLTTGDVTLKNESLAAAMNKAGLSGSKFAADLRKPDGIFVALSDLKGAFEKSGLRGDQADSLMAKLFGGGRSDKAIMSLMQNLDGIKQKYDAIGEGVRNYQSSIAKEQATPEQKWRDLIAGFKNAATGFGTELLPAFTKAAGFADHILADLNGSKGAWKDVAIGAGGLAALFTGKKLVSGIEGAFQTAETGLRFTGKILGIDKLANLGKSAGLDSAAAGLSGSASALDGAAASLEGAAASLKGGAVAGAGETAAAGEGAAGAAAARGAGGAGGGAGAAAAEGAGAGGLFSKLAGPLLAARGPLILGTVIGEVARAVGDKLSPAGTDAGTLNKTLQQAAAQGPGPAQQLHPYTMGGFEGYLAEHFSGAVSNFLGFGSGAGGGPNVFRTIAQAGRGQLPPQPMDLLGGPGHPGTVTIKPKIVPPDMSAFTAMLGQAMGAKPVKLPAPDTSALKTAAGQAQSALTALEAIHPKPIKLPSPDISALKAAVGPATSAGASAGQGFAAGISSEAGAVSAAAAGLAQAAASAMSTRLKSSSPSKVTHKIGAEEFDAGFARGIADGGTSVKAAAAQIGSNSVASLLQGLVGGQSNIQNAISAVMGAASNPDAVNTIRQTFQTLIGEVPAKDTGLVKWLTQQQGKLQALANKQGALMAQISNAQQIATSQIGAASITGAAGYTSALAASYGPLAAQQTVTGLGQMAADQSSYAKVLAQLKKEGLNATSLSQLAQEGAAQGLPQALGLAQGGKGAVAQVNAAEKQIIKASQQIAGIGGTALYGAGQAAGAGLDQGLKDQLKVVDKTMSAEANAVIARVQKALGGKGAGSSSSPAAGSAGASAGGTAASGAGAGGLDKIGPAAGAAATGLNRVGPAGGAAASGLSAVAGAAGGAASALGKLGSQAVATAGPQPGRAQPPGGGGYASGGGGGAVVHHITHVHVHTGAVLSTHAELYDHLQQASLAWGSNNWNPGWNYPGRR